MACKSNLKAKSSIFLGPNVVVKNTLLKNTYQKIQSRGRIHNSKANILEANYSQVKVSEVSKLMFKRRLFSRLFKN